MSHDATNWAIKQRGIKPALKVVLWHLCDRYNPDNGCFPSQETLAFDAEVSRSALNTYLDELEERGLIAREQRREKGSNKQERTRYRLAFEDGFEPKALEKPCPVSGHGSTAPVSENQADPSPENGESRVQNLDSNPVREPVNEPVRERVGGREVSEEEPKQLRLRFNALMIGRHNNPWPKVLEASPDWAFQQFVKLSPEERAKAEERRDAYLAACPKLQAGPNKGTPNAAPLGIYLRDKMFDLVDAIAPKVVQQQERARREADIVPVAPYGPVWGGKRALALLNGPVHVELPEDLRQTIVNVFEVHKRTSHSRAIAYANGRGIDVDGDGNLIFPPDFERDELDRRIFETGYPEVHRLDRAASQRERLTAEGRFGALADLCEAVPVGSETYERWREYHEMMNWPFVPDPGAQRVVYFPKGGPNKLQDFEYAAVTAVSKERSDDHAA